MNDFNLDRSSQDDSDQPMEDVYNPELEYEPEPERQPAFRQDLMPSVEGTASIIESSPTQINSESESSSASQVRSEELDAMDLSYDNSPNAERQQSMVAGSSADDRVTPFDIPGDQRIPSHAAPQIRPNSLAASSLTPIIATTSIFGSPTHPSQTPIISSPTPSIISVNNGTSAPSLVDNQNSTRTPSMLGGPVQQSSTYKPIQPEAHVEEDDNDIMIIDPREASLAAQQKWSSHTPHTVQNDDVVFIKQETREEAPDIPTPTPPPARMSAPPPKKPADPARMVAAQRAMMQRNKAQNARNNGEGSSRASVYSEPPLNFDRYENETFGNTGHVDPIMGCVDEDNSWMDEEDDGDEVYDSWVKLRNMLLRKQRSKTIKPDEAMSLFKVKQKIDTRDRLRAGTSREDAAGDEDPNSLFLPEKREETIARHRRDCPRQYESEDDGDNAREDHRDNSVEVHGVDNGNGEYDDDEAMAHILAENDTPEAEPDLGLTKAGKPRKRRAKAAKGPREYMQRQEEQRREKERAKAQKKKARQPNAVASSSRRRAKSPVAARGKGKGKDSGKGRGKAKEKGKASKKGKGKEVVTNGQSLLASGKFRSFGGDDAVGHMMLEDMMNNDPITDRLQNPIFDRPEEEVMVGNQTKTTQFQRLFANIPEPEDAFTRGAVRSDKAKLRDASKSFGYAKCKAVDGKWLIKGMKSPLWHHQLLGAKWMVQRELSSQAPHGGILGDSMGLGKTVQTLACMVGNPPGPEDIKRKVKATLIVCPSSITKQWVEEIGTHVEVTFFPKILHYNTSSEISLAILEDTDIVVTSYSTVMKQFPFPDREGRLEIARNGYPAWRKDALENMGMLHRVNWFRVVLDEAQHIKNNHARTSLACQNLKSVYRWCLTGTPLLNRLEELFPYLRFLKANYSMDWSTFQKYFCDPDAKDCNNRIATLLSYTMMRRTMKTTILNRPIIKLPKPHPKIVYLQFSPEEAIIYRITENRFRNNLNAFFKKGDASRNYGVFMVQLLRLRQCTSHPFMLERTIKESWTMEDVQELRVRLAKLQQLDRPFYEQCKLWVETSEASRAEARDRGEDLPDDEMLPFGQSSYGHTFDMDRALKTLNETELYERVTCSLCSDVPIEPLKTDCGHIFCKDCIETFVAQLVVQDNDYLTCPECNQMFETMEKVPLPYLEPQTYSNSRRSKSKSKAKTNGKGKEREISQDQGDGIVNFSKGRDLMGFEPVTNDSSWLTKSDRDEGFPLTPSTKTTALKALLLKGFEEAPLDKVVIYVQFRTLARIVGRICNGEGWGFLYLTGDSSLEHRDRAIKRFRDDDDVKILIAGLKCGGLGLNFPWANRCISLDLWWNHAVEQQAFGRIFRIKQEKETYMTRIVVRNTVDMRMLSMQLHKLQNLQKAMSDENTKERSSLSLKQLANLFGFLRTDGDGEILSVEPDYESEDDSREGGNGGSSGGRGRSGFGAQNDDGKDVGAGDFAGVGAGRGHGEGWGGPNRRRGMSVERETLDSDNVEADGYGNSGGYGNVMEVEDPDEDI